LPSQPSDDRVMTHLVSSQRLLNYLERGEAFVCVGVLCREVIGKSSVVDELCHLKHVVLEGNVIEVSLFPDR
jgi:hypothetical protein